MSLPSELVPKARKEDLLTTEINNELVVYDVKRFKVHILNSTSALVWKACDGTRTVPELVAFLSSQSGAEIDERVVWYTLKRLQGSYLLERSLALPDKAKRITRRELVAILGTGIVAAPIITSIIAPTPAQAQSVPPIGISGSGSGSGGSLPPPPGSGILPPP